MRLEAFSSATGAAAPSVERSAVAPKTWTKRILEVNFYELVKGGSGVVRALILRACIFVGLYSRGRAPPAQRFCYHTETGSRIQQLTRLDYPVTMAKQRGWLILLAERRN